MNKPSRGFTLIELIVVILILGIPGAVPPPRFIDLTSNARAASVNGLRGAVLSAAALANALQVSQNLAQNGTVTIEGAAVTMLNRYPTADTNGIEKAIRADSTAFTTSGAGPFVWPAAGSAATCNVTYPAPTGLGLPPTFSAPVTAGVCN